MIIIYMSFNINHVLQLIKDNNDSEFINYCYKESNGLSLFFKNGDTNIKLVKSHINKILDQRKGGVINGDEFAKNITDKYYYLIGNSDELNKLFSIFLIMYFHNVIETKKTSKDTKIHIGIDYEFTAGEISLMQMNFDTFGKYKIGYIWIIGIPIMTKKMMDILIQVVITNTRIYKILHGADAQDLPYMYEKMLNGDKDKMIKFIRKFIDTRFLCEYFKYAKSDDKKCTIYDALIYFGTITQKKYDDLDKLNKAMGPVQDVAWDITKMGSYDMRYAYYDVLYLKRYLLDIYHRIHKDIPQHLVTFKYINQLIRFVILDRRGAIDTVNVVKNDIGPINNYMVKTMDRGNMTLITIYNEIMKDLQIKDDDQIIDLNLILSLNYLKNSFTFVLKKIVYFVARVNLIVWKNKTEKMYDKIYISHIFDDLKTLQLHKAGKFCNLFKNKVENLIYNYK